MIPRHCARDRWSPGGWTRNSAPRRRAPRRGLFGSLTDGELTILRLLPGEPLPGELAADLFVSPNPLKTHLRAIYGKLGAESGRKR